MTSLKGKENDQFLPKTIYNMNKKSEKMLDLAMGITSNISDAERTLLKLEA